MTVDFHSSAQAEFLDSIYYYNEKKPNLGFEFADEVRQAVERIKSLPNGWALIDEENLIRRCQTHRFPYGLIYQVQPARILILAVMHMHRRETYWRGRL